MAEQPPAAPPGTGRSAGGPPANADDSSDGAGGFLSRWSRRKVQVRQGGTPADPVVAPLAGSVVSAPAPAPAPSPALASRQPALQAAPAPPAAPTTALPLSPTPPAPPPPAPTLADVALLGRESDYARFVAPGVESGVRNAALKKLFTDPHFNLMDGLDTYIDDYGKPDPISLADLRLMNQAHTLGLFDAKDEEEPVTRTAIADPPAPVSTASGPPPEAITPDLTPEPNSDDDADLRLQQDDASRRPGAGPGARA